MKARTRRDLVAVLACAWLAMAAPPPAAAQLTVDPESPDATQAPPAQTPEQDQGPPAQQPWAMQAPPAQSPEQDQGPAATRPNAN